MSPQDAFGMISTALVVIPCAASLAVLLLPRPKRLPVRAIVAAALGWIAWVMLTLYAYNPAGIAAAQAAGVDSPTMRYDNNTVASAILAGWLYPAMTVALALGVRRLIARRRVAGRRPA